MSLEVYPATCSTQTLQEDIDIVGDIDLNTYFHVGIDGLGLGILPRRYH
jgi:hypothetical protein